MITDEQINSVLEVVGISSEDANSLPAKILEPLAKPSDMGLTPRELYYWNEKNIIGLPITKGNPQRPWSRLNLLEVIWIRMVRDLRRFNLSFSNILKIKNYLFTDVILAFLENPDSEFERLIPDLKKRENVKSIVLEVYKGIKENPDKYKKVQIVKTFLGGLLSEILLHNSKITLHLHICNFGKNISVVIEGCRLVPFTQEIADDLKSKTRISLNLNELIAEYLIDKKFEEINTDFGLISSEELQILEAIRKKEVSEIIIKKDQDETLTFTTTVRSKLTNEKVQILKRILRMNEFDDVRVVLRNDKEIYLENKTKKKIRLVKSDSK